MAESTLIQVQHLMNELSPLEQVRLLEYLTPKIAQAISSWPAVRDGDMSAWRAFFRVGETLAADDNSDRDLIPKAVLSDLASRR